MMATSLQGVCRQGYHRSSLVQASSHSPKQPANRYSSLAILTSFQSCRLAHGFRRERSSAHRSAPFRHLPTICSNLQFATAGDGVVSLERDPIPTSKESLWAGGSKFPYFYRAGSEPVAVSYESEKLTLDTKVLQSYCETERDYVEILLNDGEWCLLSETVRAQEFWDSVRGEGTKSSPFCVRRPAAETYADRIKTFSHPPSDLSSSKVLQGLQQIDENGSGVPGKERQRLFWNHRPDTDAALQASLVYPGFGRFLDCIAEGPGVLTEEDYLDAARVGAAGHKIYKTEEDRRAAVNGALGDLLGRELSPLEIKGQGPDGSTRLTTAGSLHHNENGVSYMYVNTEVRNEAGGVYFEGQNYYRAQCADESCKPLIQASNAPCFGLDQPGPLLRVNALWYQSHIQAEPLTPAHNLLSLERYNLRQMEDLALTLRALKQEVPRLQKFVQKTVRSGDPCVRPLFLERDLPYPFYMDSDNGEENILRSLIFIGKPGGVSARQRLWLCRLPSGELVVVKFSNGYGKSVHEAWAQAGFAPKVHMCRRLPGGFYVTVMEFLSKNDGWINMAELENSVRQQLVPYVAAQLRYAHKLEVDEQGRRGALGDCQFQNIMIRFNQFRPRGPEARDAVGVRFIDFDWAGVEGVHRYPPFMSIKIDWPTGASPGWVLLQKHDVNFLHQEARR